MSGHRPAAEVAIDALLVRRMLREQFPQWAELGLEPVTAAGWDNVIFRLGDDLAVRLPRRAVGATHLERELRWLPQLAPGLPVAVPLPLGRGAPSEGYPWSWSVCQWLDGTVASGQPVVGPAMASKLAEFVTAMQRFDASGGPSNEFRGGLLAARDKEVRTAIEAVGETYGRDVLTAAWEAALETPPRPWQPTWLHGDLHPGNLLLGHGRLQAVLDFGLLGVGDPAVDLMVAWTWLPSDARQVFRAALEVDDPTWARGRGWALAVGLMIQARHDPSGIGRRAVDQVLADMS